MNKEINELDRMIIGVREWAVQMTMRDTTHRDAVVDAEEILEYAKKLEAYVLRGTKN